MARPPVNAPLREIGPWAPPAPARIAWMVVLVALAAGAIAAAGGWWAGGAVRPEAAAPAAPVISELGPVRIAASPRWTVAHRAPEAARLDPARTAVFAVDPAGSARTLFTLAPASDATLLPAGLRAALAGRPPAAQPATLLGLPAWRYAGLETRGGGSSTSRCCPPRPAC